MSDTITKREPRPEKVALVADVRERLEAADAVLFTEYRGLNVTELAELRVALAAAGGTYKIYKNTLAKVAANDLNLEIDEFLVGPTGMTFVDGDAAAVAKVLDTYRKEHEVFVIKGGMLGGAIIEPDGIKRLASLPPREQLLAKLAGLMQAPMSQFAGLMAAPLSEMAGLLGAMHQKFGGLMQALIAEGGAAPEAVAEPEPEPAAEAAEDAPADAETPDVEAADAEPAEDAPADAAAEAPTEDAAADPEPAEEPVAEEAPAEESAEETPAEPAEDTAEDAGEETSEEQQEQ